jgi:protein-disulfide isomerase
MKRCEPKLFLGLALGCYLAAPRALAQQPDEQLKKDMETLKESVKAIQKDLQEIKVLLQSRPAAPSPPSQNVVLDLGNNPFKGERTAKLTLVEISDYQ